MGIVAAVAVVVDVSAAWPVVVVPTSETLTGLWDHLAKDAAVAEGVAAVLKEGASVVVLLVALRAVAVGDMVGCKVLLGCRATLSRD